MFLPAGYPGSVTEDYIKYVVYLNMYTFQWTDPNIVEKVSDLREAFHPLSPTCATHTTSRTHSKPFRPQLPECFHHAPSSKVHMIPPAHLNIPPPSTHTFPHAVTEAPHGRTQRLGSGSALSMQEIHCICIISCPIFPVFSFRLFQPQASEHLLI